MASTKFGCFLDHYQSWTSTTFSRKEDAQKWCDEWNNAPRNYNSLFGSFAIGKHAFVCEVDEDGHIVQLKMKLQI